MGIHPDIESGLVPAQPTTWDRIKAWY